MRVKIYKNGCFSNPTQWYAKTRTDKVFLIKNEVSGKKNIKIDDSHSIPIDKYVANFNFKWLLENRVGVKGIRITGLWCVNGLGEDVINNVDYDVSPLLMLKSTVNQSENNPVKVTAKADAIVITGAENGENIKVYNTVGVEVQSTVSKSDVVNIVLPKNQIYFVNIGQARYKVAM